MWAGVVIGLLLFLVGMGATAAEIVGATPDERELNSPAVRGLPGTDVLPGVAASQDGFLVVFEHTSSAPGDNPRLSHGLFAVRLDRMGTLIDEAPFQVTGMGSNGVMEGDRYAQALVAWNGTSYMVVYDSSSGAQAALRASLVSPAGKVVAQDLIVAQGAHRFPALDWDGEHHLVVWAKTSINGLRLNADGTPAGPPLTLFSKIGYEFEDADVAWNGAYHLVTFARGSAGVRVGRDGVSIDAQPLPLLGTDLSRRSSSQGAGGSFALFWSVPASGGVFDIREALVGPEGLLGAERSVVPAPGQYGRPVSAAMGDGFFLAFEENPPERLGDTDIGAAVLTPGMGSKKISLTGTPEQQTQPAVACTPQRCLVAWSDSRDGTSDRYQTGYETDIRAALIAPDGMIERPDLLLTSAWAAQKNPRGCWNGRSYVVSWEETRRVRNRADVYLQQISAQADPVGAPLAVSEEAPDERLVAIACASDASAVLWQEGLPPLKTPTEPVPLRVRRVGNDGSLGPTLMVGSTAGFDLGLASDGQRFLVGWSSGSEIRVALLDENGVLPAGGTPVGSTPDNFSWVQVVFTGDAYLVMWPHVESIMATLVDRHGRPVAQDAFVIVPRPAGFGLPAVASTGERLALVYLGALDPTGDTVPARVLRGMLLEPDGRLIRAFDLGKVPSNEGTLGLAWDGRAFIASWGRHRDTGLPEPRVTAHRMTGLRFDPEGHVQTPAALLRPTTETDVELAWLGGAEGNSLQVWTAHEPTPFSDTGRIKVRGLAASAAITGGGTGDASVADAAASGLAGDEGCSCSMGRPADDFPCGLLVLAMFFVVVPRTRKRWGAR
jgi:hypothetical protein